VLPVRSRWAAPSRRLVLDDPADSQVAADLLAAGAVVAHGFANLYAITARGDGPTVRRANAIKGRPPGQVGSVTVPPEAVPATFDLGALTPPLTAGLVAEVVAAFMALGPFGFRGPAAPHVPDPLTSPRDGVRTTQVIVPGLACPSNLFLRLSARAVGDRPLFITSANLSHHRTGSADAPAHWRAEALRAELGGAPDLVVLEHTDEHAARARFPRHLPMSVTILALDRVRVVDGRPCLTLERHGSLHLDDVRAVLDRFGLGVVVPPGTGVRLAPRRYEGVAAVV
jgi:tRNA A37 threonylcarbamoyladenosine synthetase subunit TsaC/SUA5/YrdC